MRGEVGAERGAIMSFAPATRCLSVIFILRHAHTPTFGARPGLVDSVSVSSAHPRRECGPAA